MTDSIIDKILSDVGVEYATYRRALDRIEELHLTLPARKRAAIGYALALRDEEWKERTVPYSRRSYWYGFVLGWGVAVFGFALAHFLRYSGILS